MHVFYYCKHFHILQNLFQTVLINENTAASRLILNCSYVQRRCWIRPIDDRQYSQVLCQKFNAAKECC